MRIKACFGVLLLVVGCGDNTATGGGGSGGTSAGGNPSTGGTNAGGDNAGGDNTGGTPAGGSNTGGASASSGDCDTDDDCDPGSTCEELTPGGFRVCTSLIPEETECTTKQDFCCASTDCKAGACYNTGNLPYCAGVAKFPHNECFADQCTADSDCLAVEGGDHVCLPAGTLGYPFRTCLPVFCRLDADCTAEAGGICAPVENPCCGATSALACVYPSGCRSSGECADGYCDIDNGEGVCLPGGPTCPA